MEQRIPDTPEPSMDENFSKVAEAGFDGICVDLGAGEVDQFTEASQYYEKYGLGCMVNAFPEQLDDLQPVLQLAKDFDACMVNVIGGIMPIIPADAVPMIYRWIEDAEKTGMPLLFESHRDGLLNDLYYTLQIIDLVPESGDPAAGICHAKGNNAGMPSQWLIYITVADIVKSVKACRENGGKVIVGPKSMGDAMICVIEDPNGSVAALYQSG